MSDTPYHLCHLQTKIVADVEEDTLMGRRVLWTGLNDSSKSAVYEEWYKQPAPHAPNTFFLYVKTARGERFYLRNSGSVDIILCAFAPKEKVFADPFIETEDGIIHYLNEPQFRIGVARPVDQDHCELDYYTPSDCASIPFKLVPIV